MPAFKLTTTLYDPRRLRPKWESWLKEKDHHGITDRILNAENAQEQISYLKEVQKRLDGSLNVSEGNEDLVNTLKFLVHLFFISTNKNPIRRVLISYLQNLPGYLKSDIVGPEIQAELHSMCCYHPTCDTYGDVDVTTLMQTNQELRHNVDTLSALIGNFVVGEACVVAVSKEILSYLGSLQEQFFATFRPQLSSVQKNETMHHCMETVKLANRICQRSAFTMETRLKQQELVLKYREIVKKLVKSDLNILINDEFLLDCKTTSAMNLCLMLKYTDVGDQLIDMLCGTVFSHCQMSSVFSPLVCLPHWLAKLGFNGLSKASLNDSSYLCLCYGILSMASIETLLSVRKGRCFILDILLPEFLDLSKKVRDVGSKLLAAKSLHLLAQRIRSYIVKIDLATVDVELCDRLKGDSADMNLILDFIWTSWEDSVEAVRFTVKDIFESIIGMHIVILNSTKHDTFLDKLAVSILNDVSWSCKGKYGTLSVLVRHLGSARMLVLCPQIAFQVLQQLEEQTLACYVRDLYDELCVSHLRELNAGDQSLSLDENQHDYGWSHWCKCWVEPVINMLCQSTHMQKKHLIEYVLPKILKTSDKTLYYMIETLSDRLHDKHVDSNQYKHKGDQLGALIMCIRRARAMGLLKIQPITKASGDQSVKESLFGVVDVDLLKYALVINNEQIRLDGFALLCESQKTTELISSTELQLIQVFIPQNMTNQNPAFRQLLLSYLKKFLCRMRESMQVLRRQLSKMPTNQSHIADYQTFLRWLIRCMLESLYPGSTFPRRTTALNAVSLLIDTVAGSPEESMFYTELEPCDVQSLLHCLNDTFEDNKESATRILMACFKQDHNRLLLCSTEASKYLDLAMTLSESSRPQDGLTGAYLLQVLIQQPSIMDILKEMAVSLYGIPDTRKGREFKGSITGSHNTDLPPFTVLLDDVGGGEDERKFLLLWILLKSLEEQLEVARENLLVAAASKPMYPTMLCIRYCLCSIQFRKIKSQYHQCWSEFVSRFISLCLKISEIVSPVVHNCSPEGNIPTEAISDMTQGIEKTKKENNGSNESTNIARSEQRSTKIVERGETTSDITQSEQTVMLMPEYLTVCCWRSVKEISLILGQLTSDLPPLDSGMLTSDLDRKDSRSNSGFLSYSQILLIGDYFTTQLLDSKHRGAFELAYTGFVKVTEMLWRSNIPELHGLPKTWLKEVMEDIVSDAPNSRLCATRRSAGVPFYVQAIVSTEPSSTGRVSFKDTVVKLIELAYSLPSKDNCNPKVHALNILRMLYKDSRLKDDVTPYLADGLKVAILGFKSNLWAVRNAATLLMAAMMNRVFGVKRSKDESSLSRKNCQTGKTFFFKYPTLYQFLLDELSEATENIGTQLHPGLYPILMVLGRLFPSTMEGTDTTLNLAAFIPFVVRCCSSPVLKTRMMAARALQPLVEKDHMITVFSNLLTLLPGSHGAGIGQNQVHGVLLQLKYLLKTLSVLPSTIVDSLQGVIHTSWGEKMDFLISRSNPCLLTRKCSLEISADILVIFGNDETILYKVLTVLNVEVSDVPDSIIYPSSAPCLTEFLCTVCELYIQCMCTYWSEEVASGTLRDVTGSDGVHRDLFSMGTKSEKDATLGARSEEVASGTLRDVTGSDGVHRDLFSMGTKSDKDATLGARGEEVASGTLRDVTGSDGVHRDLLSMGTKSDKDATLGARGDRNGELNQNLMEGKLNTGFQFSVEDLCIKFLRSKSYEVRKSFFKKVTDVCLHGNTGEVSDSRDPIEDVDLGIDIKDRLGMHEKCYSQRFRTALAASLESYKLLLELCLSETHKECQVHLFGLLQVYPDIDIGRYNNPDLLYKLRLDLISEWLNRLQHTTLSEEVMSSCIEYLSATLSIMYHPVIVGGSESPRAPPLSHMQNFINTLSGLCRAPETAVSVQLACAHALVKIPGCDILHAALKGRVNHVGSSKFGDIHEGDAEGGVKIEGGMAGRCSRGEGGVQEMDPLKDGVIISGCIERFYMAVFDLLQVDDLEVKEAISDVMLIISDDWFRGSPQSYICTSLLMNHWVQTSPDVSLVAGSLLKLMIENQEPEQKEDERLFDRGEMNTYRDQIDFIQTIDDMLMMILLGDNFSELSWKNIGISKKVDMTTISMATNSPCDTRLCDTLLPVILDYIKPEIPQCSGPDIFLDWSKHEEQVQMVYTNILFIKYGFLLATGTDVRNDISEIWTQIKTSLDTSVLPIHVRKVVVELCNYRNGLNQSDTD